MRTLSYWVAAFLFVSGMGGLTVRLWWDLKHPQVWQKPADDPAVYGWMVGALWLVWLAIFVTAALLLVWAARRDAGDLARAVEVEKLLASAEESIGQGLFDEAEVYLEKAKKASGFKDTNSGGLR